MPPKFLMLLLAILALAACTSNLRRPAPELEGVHFINTAKKLTLAKLHGRIVLIDFWAYSCVNCLHVVSQIKQLEKKFGKDLVVIGVHSPKYANEKNDENVRAAVARLGIDHPVANDPDLKGWQEYGVQAWPTFILIDPAGRIANQFVGDSKFKQLDSAIGALVSEGNQTGSLSQSAPYPQLAQPISSSQRALSPSALRFPSGITCDPQTNLLYICDTGHHRIVSASKDGKLVEVIGNGTIGHGTGSFVQASFCDPSGLTLHGSTLYVADKGIDLIRQIDLSKKTVSTLAKNLNTPCGLAVLHGNLYIAMSGCHELWCLDLKTLKVTSLAGNGFEDLKDGKGTAAQFAQPTGITTDGKYLYVSDAESSSIRQFDPASNIVKTLVGQSLYAQGDRDGALKSAQLQHPLGICIDGQNIYIADTFNHKIKCLSLQNQTVSTVVGNGKPGFRDGEWPMFAEPSDVCVMHNVVYVADTNNNVVRTIDLASGKVSTLNLK